MTHVYLMPGMGAGPEIFEYIRLPEDKFEIHLLHWKLPLKNEPIRDYAQRMCSEVAHQNCVLIGVSLGGIVVQEMNHFLSVKRLIIVSSVKSKFELPRKMRFAKITGAYRFLPTSLLNHTAQLQRFPLGKFVKKRLQLYQRYMEMSDRSYLDWAIDSIVHWKREHPINGVVHIHGEKDIVFPIKYIHDCIVVPEGTHIMIINKYRWFNKHLPTLINEGKLAE